VYIYLGKVEKSLQQIIRNINKELSVLQTIHVKRACNSVAIFNL